MRFVTQQSKFHYSLFIFKTCAITINLLLFLIIFLRHFCDFFAIILMIFSSEQTTVIQDLAADPTLPRTSARCTKCGHKEAVYFQSSSSKPDEAMTLYFICCNSDCGHKWKE
eukprot:TRINITY_DN2777_c0_g1_i3.p1 TRINITY_DN2777_c0_g1~~TRINITY_DN2777_c0_g1_i3.p1  ORF type:complete len:112 (+),score=9.68 TRINITY_DN2777_c0_g1_i3:269-604(+)